MESLSLGSGRPRKAAVGRGLHGREVLRDPKRGPVVGKAKREKGSKCMVVVSCEGIPLAIHIGSASPAEVTLVEKVLEQAKVLKRRELTADSPEKSNRRQGL